jgi:hypothetical protein
MSGGWVSLRHKIVDADGCAKANLMVVFINNDVVASLKQQK